MVELLALVLHHDEQVVLCAVELALEAGAVSKQHVLNVLSRLLQATPPAPVEAPQALTLLDEPRADVNRYEALRGHLIKTGNDGYRIKNSSTKTKRETKARKTPKS